MSNHGFETKLEPYYLHTCLSGVCTYWMSTCKLSGFSVKKNHLHLINCFSLSNKQDLLLVLPIVGITMGVGQVVGSFVSLAFVRLL